MKLSRITSAIALTLCCVMALALAACSGSSSDSGSSSSPSASNVPPAEQGDQAAASHPNERNAYEEPPGNYQQRKARDQRGDV